MSTGITATIRYRGINASSTFRIPELWLHVNRHRLGEIRDGEDSSDALAVEFNAYLDQVVQLDQCLGTDVEVQDAISGWLATVDESKLVIEHRDELFAVVSVDAALDTAEGQYAERLVEAVRRGGRDLLRAALADETNTDWFWQEIHNAHERAFEDAAKKLLGIDSLDDYR